MKSMPFEKIHQFGMNQADEIPIPSFDENLLINLCLDAQHIFEKEDVILDVDGDTIVVGDIHGSLHDLLRILKYIDISKYKVIFLGDYVDRGNFSLECITLLFTLKIIYPNKYFLLRGNHEFDVMCSQYGFKREILNYHNPKKLKNIQKEPSTQEPNNNDSEKCDKKVSNDELCEQYFANHLNMNCHKYTEELYDAFMKAFSFLPIAAIVNKTSLCIHGGLSPLFDKVDKIRKQIQRPIDNYDHNELLCDILWGDPSVQLQQFYEMNPRGRGQLFNGVVVVNFLKNNNLQRIIRAHQCVNQGIEMVFNEKCITVFSASSYNRDMGNFSGILKISQKDDKVQYVQFDPFHRLNKCDAIYYKVQAFNDLNNTARSLNSYSIRSMASCMFLHTGMTHSKSIDNSSIVLNDDSINNNNNNISNHSPHNLFKSKINLLPKRRKISHCCSLFPKEIHHHLNFIHLTHHNKGSIDDVDEENVGYHSDTDEKDELQAQQCLPGLTPKVVY